MGKSAMTVALDLGQTQAMGSGADECRECPKVSGSAHQA